MVGLGLTIVHRKFIWRITTIIYTYTSRYITNKIIIFGVVVYCQKSNQNFLHIIRNVEEHEILHEIFLVVSRFPRYISCFISENRLPVGMGVGREVGCCGLSSGYCG